MLPASSDARIKRENGVWLRTWELLPHRELPGQDAGEEDGGRGLKEREEDAGALTGSPGETVWKVEAGTLLLAGAQHQSQACSQDLCCRAQGVRSDP